jgi:hypothetical protein
MVSSVYLTQAMFNVETRTTQMSKLTIIVTNFRRFRRGTLFGYATVYIPELRLSACDVAVHRHASGASWVALPARPVVSRDGVVSHTSDGRIQYANYSASTVRNRRSLFEGRRRRVAPV